MAPRASRMVQGPVGKPGSENVIVEDVIRDKATGIEGTVDPEV